MNANLLLDQTHKAALIRHQVFKTIRNFFYSRAYIEIDAPILVQANAVEAQIDPLLTSVQRSEFSSAQEFQLITSPEIHMKRLLARGLSRIFYLGHVFRDREFSPIHRPEFTMLEWYEAGSTLDSIQAFTQELFLEIAKDLDPLITPHTYIASAISDLSSPFESISMAYAWENYANIDLLECLYQISKGDPDALVSAVKQSGESLRDHAEFEDAFTHIMLKKIEPQIGIRRPTVLIGWPAQTAALAQLSPENPLIADRFEIYWRGVELANAFAELVDGKTQKKRFADANEIRRSSNKNMLPIDQDFIRDLAKIPPVCGIAVGIDRLIGLLTDQQDLNSVVCLDSFSQKSIG